MLILVLGIFYTWLAYKKAKQKGRSPIGWAAIAAATFLGTQILVASGIGLVLGLWNWSESVIDDYSLQLVIATLLACSFTNWLVTRPLNKVPDKSFDKPPAPPTFESNEN